MSKPKEPDPLAGYTFTRSEPAAKLRARLLAGWKRDRDVAAKTTAKALRAQADALDPPGGSDA